MQFPFSAENNYEILIERNIGNLRLRKASYSPGRWSGKHTHENARFVFVLKGNFTERYERKERFCQPFTSIFRPPIESHSEIYEPGVVCLSVDISPLWLKRLEDYSVKLNKSNDLRNLSMTYLIGKISREINFDDDVSSLAIDSLLTEIAVETHRNLAASTLPKSPDWLKLGVEYIHEHYSSNLSLQEIALISDVHPVHLARVFRNKYRCTIAEYIRRLRIETACKLMLNSDLTMAQIALETGFTDQSHFIKVFKRLTNKTPAEFKKAHKNAF